MSFLGLAFEMGVKDVGKKTLGDIIKKLDSVNALIETQEKISKSAAKAMEGVNKDVERTFVGIGRRIGRAMNIAKDSVEPFVKDMGKVYGILDNTFRPLIDWGSKFRKSTSETTEKLDDLSGSVDGVSKSVSGLEKSGDGFGKKFGGTLDGLMKRVTQFNVASIAANMKTLTGETGNLTNSLEATMAGMMQTTKPVAASLNLTGKEMKKFASKAASLAYSMNLPADAMVQTMSSMHNASAGAKDAMDAMNMGTRDWAKIVQTTSVPMEDFTAILGDMTTNWKASPKQAAAMLDNLMAIGKAAGTGTGPIRGAKAQLAELDGIFSSLPPSMKRTSTEIQGLMESSARMGGVFKQMGATQEEALSNSNAVAKMFAEQDVAISKALAIGDEKALGDNPLLKYMMQLGVGFDKAKEIISLGSRDTVAGMAEINKLYSTMGTDKRAGVQRALADLSGALGQGSSGLAFLAANADKGTKALSDMQGMVIKGDGALKKFGKDAYDPGLTLQDTYDRAKLSFDTMVRSIARADVKGLVGKQIAGMREAGKELKALGSDETWGPWINALSQYKQMGIGGIFASMAQSSGIGAKNAAKFGAKVGLITESIGQLGQDLGPVMQMLGMFGPLGVIGAGAGIAGLFMMSPSDRKNILGPFNDVFENIKAKVTGLFSGVKWEELWEKFKSGAASAFTWLKTQFETMKDSGIFTDIANGLSSAFQFVASIFPWESILNGAAAVLQKVADVLAKDVDWSALGTALAGVFKTILPSLIEVIKSALSGAFQAFASLDTSDMLFAAGGIAFMAALSNPVSGIAAVAAAAGFFIGTKVGEAIVAVKNKLTGEDLVSRGVRASKEIMTEKEDVLKFSVMDSPKYLDEKLNLIKSALAEESSSIISNPVLIKRLEDGIKYIEKIKSEAFSENQKRNIEMDGGGFTESDLYNQTVMPTAPWEGELLLANQEGALLGGQSVAEQMVAGVEDTLKSTQTAERMDAAIEDGFSSALGQSPPLTGPLSGEFESSKVYMAGYSSMEQFALGIADSTDMIRQTVEMALDESVILALDTYAAKMNDLAKQKGFLASVAEGIIGDMGAKIEAADVESNVDVKKSFEVAMSLPGMASVTLAVINEGAATRKMLKKILDENVKQTILMQGGTVAPAIKSTTAGPA